MVLFYCVCVHASVSVSTYYHNMIALIYSLSSTTSILIPLNEKKYCFSNSHSFQPNYLQKYNHLQRPSAADFSRGELNF